MFSPKPYNEFQDWIHFADLERSHDKDSSGAMGYCMEIVLLREGNKYSITFLYYHDDSSCRPLTCFFIYLTGVLLNPFRLLPATMPRYSSSVTLKSLGSHSEVPRLSHKSNPIVYWGPSGPEVNSSWSQTDITEPEVRSHWLCGV